MKGILRHLALARLHDPVDEDAFTLGLNAARATLAGESNGPAVIVWQGQGLPGDGRSAAGMAARWLALTPETVLLDLPNDPLGPARALTTGFACATAEAPRSVLLIMASTQVAVSVCLYAAAEATEAMGSADDAVIELEASAWRRVEAVPMALVHGMLVSGDQRLWREQGATPLLRELLTVSGSDPFRWLAAYPAERRALRAALASLPQDQSAAPVEVVEVTEADDSLAPLLVLAQRRALPGSGLLLWLGGGEGAAWRVRPRVAGGSSPSPCVNEEACV